MTRLFLAVGAVFLAALLSPVHQDCVKEKVFLSRTCPDARWYLDTSDDQSATLVCYELTEEK